MKYILSVLFLFFFASAFSQVYQEMPQYGYRANRFAFDSTLQIPTTCGVPTLKSVISVNKKSAIAFDSCNNRFYYYNPVSATWILLTGGGTTITSDTAKIVIAQVRNAESTTLQIGEVVYLKGSTGNTASVKRASNRDDSTSSRTLGVVRAAISPNATGYVTTQGQCEKMNLGAYNEGDVLWLDSIAGGLTKSKPIAPFHGVFIGIVERANQGNGIAYIKPQNGYELGEIHDVQIINPTNNQVLVYSDTQKIWKNRNALDTTSLSLRINTKFAIADTGNKWVNSVTKVNDTTIRVIKNTTTTDFVITGRVIDTTSLSNRINTKLAIADTSNKWVNSVTKLNDSTIRVIKNTTTSDLLIRGNPQQATGSNGLSGTSIIKLGGNLDNGTTAIESTTDGLSSLTFGSTRKLDAVVIRNNQTTINSGSDIFLVQPTSGTDTTTYKPLGVASNGKVAKINNWFAGSAAIDTSNKFVNAVAKINDSTIRVFKGSTSTDLLIRGNASGGGATPTLQEVTTAGATTTDKITMSQYGIYNNEFNALNGNRYSVLNCFAETIGDIQLNWTDDINTSFFTPSLIMQSQGGTPPSRIILKNDEISLQNPEKGAISLLMQNGTNEPFLYLPAINNYDGDTIATLYDVRNKGYKIYSATISASGGSSPTLQQQFINEIGVVTFSVNASVYIIQCTGCFPANKTYIAKPNFKAATFTQSANAYRYDNDNIYIEVFSAAGTQVLNTFDDMMLEIKVYN